MNWWNRILLVCLVLVSESVLSNVGMLPAAEKQTLSAKALKLDRTDGEYNQLCFSSDSKKVYAANYAEGTIHVWDLYSANRVMQISVNRPVNWTQLYPLDENLILITDQNGVIWKLDLERKSLVQFHNPPSVDLGPRSILAIDFDRKRSQLILVRGNGWVDYLDYQGGQITRESRKQFKLEHDIKQAVFARDHACFATVEWSNNVSLLQTNDAKLLWRNKYDKKISHLSFGLSRDVLVLSQIDGTCLGFDTQSKKIQWRVSCKSRLVKTEISQNGKAIYALSGGIRKKQAKTGIAVFQIYRISDGELMYRQKLKGDIPSTLKCSADGRFVAAVSGGGLYLWKIGTSETIP